MLPEQIEKNLNDPEHKIFSPAARQRIYHLMSIPELDFHFPTYGRMSSQKSINLYLNGAMHYLEIDEHGNSQWYEFDIDGYRWKTTVGGLLDSCFYEYKIAGGFRDYKTGCIVLKYLDLLR